MRKFVDILYQAIAALNRSSAKAQETAQTHEKAYSYALSLQERMDHLLAHYGLEHLITREAFGDFHDVPFEQGFLLLVPILEAQKIEIEELRAKVIWGDSDTRG